MISRATACRSRWPCMMPEIRARLVFSQSCSWLVLVVSRRVAIIWLIVSFSAATSPAASTVIFRVRSPRVTPVDTSAIARSWMVSVLASWFTLSVSRFQVPDTPSTSAWTPSLPSVPTSRATLVTSSANAESWSTIVLIVVFSSRISPRASTSILRRRSPRATAVVTSAMLRTWLVRLPAIELTLSVRSFQTPATPGTLAWPPSMPSVPTSRATRVTSSANARSVSTIVLIVWASAAVSPCASIMIFWDRSPRPTAVATVAMDRTWLVRLPAIELTLSVRSFQVPDAPRTLALPPSTPSVPTSRATRVTSSANARSWSTIVFTVVFSSSISPATSTVTVRDRSPLATAVVTSAMSRTWLVSRLAIVFTESVRSRQVPETPRTLAWPPSLPSVPTSRATRVTSSAKSRSWATMPLTVLAIRRNSPRSRWSPERRSIIWVRSPAATAPSTRPTSTVGRTSSSTRSLAAVTAPAQAPSALPGRSRSSSRPSRPTTRRTRSSSPVRCRLRSTTSLTTVASRAIGESASPGTRSRTRKSPSRTAVSAVSSRSTSASSSPRGGSGSARRPVSRRGRRGLSAAFCPAPTAGAATATSSNRAGWPGPFASLARLPARTIGPVPLLERDDQLRRGGRLPRRRGGRAWPGAVRRGRGAVPAHGRAPRGVDPGQARGGVPAGGGRDPPRVAGGAGRMGTCELPSRSRSSVPPSGRRCRRCPRGR